MVPSVTMPGLEWFKDFRLNYHRLGFFSKSTLKTCSHKVSTAATVECTRAAKRELLLLHEVVNFRVDPLDDGHQVVENVFCVVHRRIHEVPKTRVEIRDLT